MMRRLSSLLLSHWGIGSVCLALLAVVYVTDDPLIASMRNRSFDAYQQLKPRTPDPKAMAAQVAIVDIDDASLTAIGQWPWPRTTLAKLVDNLHKLGVLVVGFDIVFAEADRLSPPRLPEQLPHLPPELTASLKQLPSSDTLFAESIANARVVLGQSGTEKTVDLSKLTQKVGYGYRGTDPAQFLAVYPGVVQNLHELEAAAKGIGLFSTLPGDDGIYRQVALIERVGDMIYPTLSLEMLRVALGGQDDYFLKTSPEAGVEQIVVRTADPEQNFVIPTDRHGRVWVHYAQYSSGELYVSAKDVLALTPESHDALKQKLGDRLVIVGTSATGLKDIRATPINPVLPGVEVHAQLLETILAQAYLTRPAYAPLIELGLVLGAGLALLILVPRLKAGWNFLLCTGAITGAVTLSWHFYRAERMLVDASFPALSIFCLFVLLTYLNYMREEKQRAYIKDAFSHYLSPALLQELAANPDKLKLGGETRNITLLFSDIRGFTTISEQFDAQGLTQFINRFLTPMTDVIMAEKGTIDKYMGDAIMAFWNAPLDVPDHATRAARAALGMQAAVKALNVTLEEEAKTANRKHIPVAIGVGLNTGDCCVGNMGSDQRFDYSALGDHVNLASRLEGQSKPYGVDIVIGENTVKLLEGFALVELDWIQVKGKTEPVTIYALIGDEKVRDLEAFQSLVKENAEMLRCYRAQAWDKAETHLRACENYWPDLRKFYALYRERIADFRRNPPPSEWNGVYIATSK
ncbi:MAG: adenylate/guanylate cyclase domain-containing protein [Alphaproteobacteria bacterium]|nr:adenylate/guanylate cyclase domain-containing protein [Alphaproteobacteria bacterium]